LTLVLCERLGVVAETEKSWPTTGGANMARRAKAVHPTQIAPITVKIISLAADGILSSASSCVAL
jgi:hypothetical protein